jgi:hypothetical protein
LQLTLKTHQEYPKINRSNKNVPMHYAP